jgi:hypothetical protein
VPEHVRFPHELGPGDRLGGLAFAELAAAFRGVAEVDAATGEASIADRAPEGAPARVRFRVDRRGVVALRALDGHPWSEEVPPGRPVFGVPAEILRAAGEGVLELDASGLEARPAEPPPAVPGRGAARDRVVDGGHPPGASRPSVRRRLRPALLLGVLLPVVLAAGGAGWWLLADPARDRAAAEAAGLPAAGPPLPAAPVPAAPPPPKPPEPAVVQDVDRTGPVAGAAGPVVAPVAQEPRGAGPVVERELEGDPLTALEALASGAGDPRLAAELGGIAAALRRERQARQEERGRAAAAAIATGAQLARVYRRDAADLRRLETAAGVCGEDAACRQRYGPALARAATARELTRDAYVRLLRQVAADYTQELLDRELGAAAGAVLGNPDEAATLDELAGRFVDQVARRRDGAASGEPEAVVGELLEGAPPSAPPEPPPARKGMEP